MATRVEEMVDEISRKSCYVPIGTHEGMRRLKKNIYTSLKRKVVEDDISVVRGFDFSIIENSIVNEEHIGQERLYVDIMPKLKLVEPIKKTNLKLLSVLGPEGIILSSSNGLQRWKKYEMPIKRFRTINSETPGLNRLNECYLVYNIKDGKMDYPTFNGYRAPIIKFDCYSNLEFGRKVVKIAYDALSVRSG
jgi:hypothetical protein